MEDLIGKVIRVTNKYTTEEDHYIGAIAVGDYGIIRKHGYNDKWEVQFLEGDNGGSLSHLLDKKYFEIIGEIY